VAEGFQAELVENGGTILDNFVSSFENWFPAADIFNLQNYWYTHITLIKVSVLISFSIINRNKNL
jgi:hypothetical protein